MNDAHKQTTYVHASTHLPLKRWRDIPAFLGVTRRIQEAMKELPGLVTYQLKADLMRKTFRTTSVWENQQAISRLMALQPHQEAVRRFHEWAAAGAKTVTWTSNTPTIDWNDATTRVAQGRLAS